MDKNYEFCVNEDIYIVIAPWLTDEGVLSTITEAIFQVRKNYGFDDEVNGPLIDLAIDFGITVLESGLLVVLVSKEDVVVIPPGSYKYDFIATRSEDDRTVNLQRGELTLLPGVSN